MSCTCFLIVRRRNDPLPCSTLTFDKLKYGYFSTLNGGDGLPNCINLTLFLGCSSYKYNMYAVCVRYLKSMFVFKI